jgi:transketolase
MLKGDYAPMQPDLQELKSLCKEVRRDIVKMTAAAGSGHPGGSLSSVELLVGLYFAKMRHDPQRPDWADRDRFILSKGHVAPVLYSVLARSGYFPVEELLTLRKLGSRLQGHPHMLSLPGLDNSSGSLGQGLSQANGLALASRLNKQDYRVYCLLGDGELQEGQVWEAVMTAAHYKLANVCAIVDYNNLQIDGTVEEVMGLHPIADKWQAFDWHVISIDGHDIEQVLAAYDEAASVKDKPSVIIAKTVKGKGVSFMENVAGWHGRAPKEDELAKALAELAN